MRDLSDEFYAAWLAEDKTGSRRPNARATIQKLNLRSHSYEMVDAPGGPFEHQKEKRGRFKSWLGETQPVVEIPNIRTIHWTRAVEQDMAECTLTLANTEVVPIGEADDTSDRDTYDRFGWMTPSRGDTGYQPMLGNRIYNLKADWTDLSDWNTGGSPSVGSHQLTLDDGEYVEHKGWWDLRGSSVAMHVISGNDAVMAFTSASGSITTTVDATNITLSCSTAGDQVVSRSGANWFKMRFENTSLIFESSTDGQTWDLRHTVDGPDVIEKDWKRGRFRLSADGGTVVFGAVNLKPSPWAYGLDSEWNMLLAPDRMVCTYEGYGIDRTVIPARDENLMPSGIWLIDDVDVDEEGELVLAMRDMSRLLDGMIVFPPGIPFEHYPLMWSTIRTEHVQARDATGGSWNELGFGDGATTSSNAKYVGATLTNLPYPNYVTLDGDARGHKSKHVLKDDMDFYWESAGDDSYEAFAYWEIDFTDPKAMAGVRMRVKNGPYRVYVSVKTPTGWMGKKEVPYTFDTEAEPLTPASVNIGADIPYVATDLADRNKTFDIIFPHAYSNVRKLRITFTRMRTDNISEHPFTAGLRMVSCYQAATKGALGFGKGTVDKVVGNYADYTDVIRWMASWGGFFWPDEESGMNFFKIGDGDQIDLPYADGPSPKMPRGRCWGRLQATGTAGVADLTPDLFDKKPLLEGINYIADLLGFNFWVDEQGAVVWRMPNIWEPGNYTTRSDHLGRPTLGRTEEYVTLNTEEHILSKRDIWSSKNRRERIFVSNITGKIGTVIKGYRPYPATLRRVAGWTDQHFETQAEVVVMADMIAAKQMFQFKRARIQINGNPAIQQDDQIRVFAPVTNDTFFHYVMGIDSNIDLTTGKWTYDLDVHWLGENREDAWVVSVEQLEGATQRALSLLGVGDDD